MYGSRAMLGGGVFSDGYEVGSKRQRMTEPHPYLAVSDGTSSYQPYNYGGRRSTGGFPVVKLRGLPFNCSDNDIFKFFAGLHVVDVLLVNKNGMSTGEAFVVFASPLQAELAVQRDRQNMGRRYVEVFTCNKQDYYRAVASDVKNERVNDEHHASPSTKRRPTKSAAVDKDQLEEFTNIIKMRGLPYSATKSDIVEFFDEFELKDDSVHIAIRPDKKATGEAFVEFESVDDARKAMGKDRMTIGSRYVELFPSTPDEVKRAKSRSGH